MFFDKLGSDDWRIRRRIVILTLLWSAALVTYLAVYGTSDPLRETSATSLILLIGSVVAGAAGNVAVELAMRVFGSLAEARVLVLGTGDVGRQVVQALVSRGASQVSVASRTFENARVLAEGLERTGADPTRAKLRSALAGIRNWDLGGFVVDYSGQAPYVGSRYVDLGVLGGSGRFMG